MELHSLRELEEATNVASHWRYKSEGELNLVLTYTGPHPTLRAKVLRLKKRHLIEKAPPPSPASLPQYFLHPSLSHFNGEQADDAGQAFVRHVVAPLLGPAVKYLHFSQPVKLTKAFVGEISAAVEPLRPEKRKAASTVDLDGHVGYLMEDLSVLYSQRPQAGPKAGPGGRLLGVELKPKWGFLPASPFVAADSVKRKVCRYCMHQFTKLKQANIHHLSQFCPLDLFSKDHARIRFAMDQLLLHPQNNLKVYMDGAVLYTGSLGGQSESSRLTLDAVGSQLAAALALSNDSALGLLLFSELVAHIVMRETFLDALRQVQVEGDCWDVEGVMILHHRLLQWQHEGRNLDDLSQKLPLADEERIKFGGDVTLKHALDLIRAFLVAATAKDCSVLISVSLLQPGEHTSHATVELQGRRYQYRVAIIDLDPKPVKNLPYYYKLDAEIVATYVASHPAPAPCGSQRLAPGAGH